MIIILNGFQCEKCNTVYSEAKEATECENSIVELPLVPIGTILDDEYEDHSFKMRVSRIYYDGHEVCYRFEMKTDGVWGDCLSYFGNENLIKQFGDQIK